MFKWFLKRVLRKYKADFQRDVLNGTINPNVAPNLPHFLGWLEGDETMYRTGLDES